MSEPIKDPGLFFSDETLVEYGDQVNKLIQDMARVLLGLRSKGQLTPTATRIDQRFSDFVGEWTPFYEDLPGSFFRGKAWTATTKYHKKALEYKEEFERAGVVFKNVVVVPVLDSGGKAVGEKAVDARDIAAPGVPSVKADEQREAAEERAKEERERGALSPAKAVGYTLLGVLAVAGAWSIGTLVRRGR